MAGMLSSSGSSLDAINSKLATAGGGTMDKELSQILAYHEKQVARMKAQIDARAGKVLEDAVYGDLPLVEFKYHTRDDILTEQEQWEVKQQAEQEVQTEYDASLLEKNSSDVDLLHKAASLISNGDSSLSSELATVEKLSKVLEAVHHHQA